MNLEKIWNHPSNQQSKKQIEEDILDEQNKTSLIKEPRADINIEQCGNVWLKFQETDKILEEVSQEDLYLWYSTAMERRGREPLSEDSFSSHFLEGGSYDDTFAYGEKEKGYLLGFNKFGVFTPTHFAPKTLRGGYDLFQALGDNRNIPAILSVTEDLADTLEKMPSWHKLEIKKEIRSYFRGEIVKKEIYYNSNPDVKNLMWGLLMEYINKEDSDSHVEEFLDSDN